MNANNRKALQEATKTLRFLSNAKLLPILCRLRDEEVSAGELARFAGISPSALSQHLRRLKDRDLIAMRRDHRTLYYRLTDEKLRVLTKLLQELYCPDETEIAADPMLRR